MSIGVNSKWASLSIANRSAGYTRAMETSVNRLTSGSRIASAGDDPAGLVTAGKISAKLAGLGQANTNVQNDQALLNVADGALGNAVSIVQRMKELAVQATDVTLESRDGITQEFSDLTQRLNDIGTNTKFGGQAIFGTSFKFMLGGDAGTSFELASMSTPASYLSATASNLGTASGAASSISSIETTLNNLLTLQSKVGGHMNAMGFIADNISTEATNLQSAYSTMMDVNTAAEMTSYVKNSIMLQSTQMLAALQNQNAHSVLNLMSA